MTPTPLLQSTAVAGTDDTKSTPSGVDRNMDRLSNLPDKIAEAILCNLPGEDIIRLSLASKRLRKLCSRNTPFLTFHHGFRVSNLRSFSRFNKVSWSRRVSCVNSFMNLRHYEGTQIKSFHLSWLLNCCPGDGVYINKWLFQAVACKVESINLNILSKLEPQPIELDLVPVFNSKTLKKLVINLSVKGFSLSPLPSYAIHLNSLHHLKLQYVCFSPDGRSFDVGKMVSNSCKSLRELYLVHCYGPALTINSSSLHLFHLYCAKPPPPKPPPFSYAQNSYTDLYVLHIIAENLQELDIVWYPIRPTMGSSMLELCTPNLQVFNWTGYPTQTYWCVKKLAHLEQARLNFMEINTTELVFNKPHIKIDEVICSIDNITSLQPLCLQSVVVLAQCNVIPFMFHRLKTLVLVSNGLGASEVEPLKSLLMGAPNLIEFKLTSHGLPPHYNPFSDVAHSPRSAAPSTSCYDVKYWECGVLQFVQQLKILTIELYEGPFVLEFFRFLLKNAQVLEKVTVYYSPPSFPQEAAAIISEFKKDFTMITIRVA